MFKELEELEQIKKINLSKIIHDFNFKMKQIEQLEIDARFLEEEIEMIKNDSYNTSNKENR